MCTINGMNIWVEVVLIYFMYYKNTCLNRLAENVKYFSQDGHSAGWELNLQPKEYEAEICHYIDGRWSLQRNLWSPFDGTSYSLKLEQVHTKHWYYCNLTN